MNENVGNSDFRLLSIVAPAYNEEDVINDFHSCLAIVLGELNIQYEVLYVNDGSKDNTAKILFDLQRKHNYVSVINLSRNFGKELALTAGLDHAAGDLIVVIDTDLQDPPELIPDLIAKMHEGYDMVYAKRVERDGESWLKKLTAFLFYRFINKLSDVEIPEDTGDYRILNRIALNELNKLREHHRFMKGLFAWVGFRQTGIPYYRNRRHAGQTKWNYKNLWNFAIEGITSFSTKPLKIASYLGLLTASVALVYAIMIIFEKIVYGNPVAGYPSLMVTVLFLGGVQLITLGIIGEYLARTFNEAKQRPLYIIDKYIPALILDQSDDYP
jgi:glycosyltransferase involved in cell wall biosynthesis